ncbi:hypothetical protein JNK13_06005 [bacterium]|nr:hypothetical protein [bacterium]
MVQAEYTASEMREILRRLFPERRLVLSQFTFFNHSGITKPSGLSYKRGRRCFCLVDILPIAVVLTLKEQGIPLKNANRVPLLVQEKAQEILSFNQTYRLTGFGSHLCLTTLADPQPNIPLEYFLNETKGDTLFWGLDLSAVAQNLLRAINGETIISEAFVDDLELVAA